MVNLLDNEIYVTSQEVIDTTNRDDLANESTDTIDSLITKAQYVIDDYINQYGEPYDEKQDFIFPIKDDDGNSLVPKAVKIATVYTVENLYDNLGEKDHDGKISSESLGYYDVSYEDGVNKSKIITDRIKTQLSQYHSIGARPTL